MLLMAGKSAIDVSIHATLAGGDAIKVWPNSRWSVFLSTPPSRVATAAAARNSQDAFSFYPRHPRGWRPKLPCKNTLSIAVSIHATLAGGDASSSSSIDSRRLFLSTPPSRVATAKGLDKVTDKLEFLSTPPSRVATALAKIAGDFYYVSIHATLAGGDFGGSSCSSISSMFLSTPPSRVATFVLLKKHKNSRVSIHATLAGGDADAKKMRTELRKVSIHATLAGGDL